MSIESNPFWNPFATSFGAVFFVSVGMLLDPAIIWSNWREVLLITAVIISGKVISVTFASLASGQSPSNAVYAGLSLGQIGEFSFIIATLGLNNKVIDPKLYPIIVASSLLTTFTTPYMIKAAPRAGQLIEKYMPEKYLLRLLRYENWLKSLFVTRKSRVPGLSKNILKWLANAIVIITIFSLLKYFAIEPLSQFVTDLRVVNILLWGTGFLASTPFLWGMTTIFRPQAGSLKEGPTGGLLFLSQILTLLLVGYLSSSFLSFRVAVGLTFAVGLVLFMLLWKRIDSYYQWFEEKFASGFIDDEENPFHRYAPWDMFLVEVLIDAESKLVGQTLVGSQLREKYGINVVVMKRGRRAYRIAEGDGADLPGRYFAFARQPMMRSKE